MNPIEILKAMKAACPYNCYPSLELGPYDALILRWDILIGARRLACSKVTAEANDLIIGLMIKEARREIAASVFTQ